MTKDKEAAGGKNHKKGSGKGKGHTHNVVQHTAKKQPQSHNKEYDPVYIGVGDLPARTHVAVNENLSNKDKRMMEKLEAQLEYAEAHGESTDKIRARMEQINERGIQKASHDDPVKVVHGGGHWKHHHHAENDAE